MSLCIDKAGRLALWLFLAPMHPTLNQAFHLCSGCVCEVTECVGGVNGALAGQHG